MDESTDLHRAHYLVVVHVGPFVIRLIEVHGALIVPVDRPEFRLHADPEFLNTLDVCGWLSGKTPSDSEQFVGISTSQIQLTQRAPTSTKTTH